MLVLRLPVKLLGLVPMTLVRRLLSRESMSLRCGGVMDQWEVSVMAQCSAW